MSGTSVYSYNNNTTGTMTLGNNITWQIDGQPIQYVWTYPQSQPLPKVEKMTEYVVTEIGTNGNIERKKLIIGASINGVGATLSESETQQVAELICKLLGLTFVGRA